MSLNEHSRFDGGIPLKFGRGLEKCVAVVVTFNRSALLRNCLAALGRQSRPLDGIIVVDNASSDDTDEAVREFASTSRISVSYRRLAANVGGAGGFSFGTRLACSLGFTEIWMMDDDGVPADNALEELLAIEGPAIRNALVVDIDDHSKLAFPLEFAPDARTVEDAQALGPIANNSVNPFNGTLVSSYVFGALGYPYAGFFIWGDEVEFVHRVRAQAYGICTVTHALHYHPSNRKKPYRLFGRFSINTTDDTRLPIYMRNYSHNLYHHAGTGRWLAFMAKHLAYEVLVSRSPRRFASALRASLTGISSFTTQVRSGAKAPYDPSVATSQDFTKLEGKADR